MELVYLWVEEYKNIKKQGFNFSPNFECEFTPIYEGDKLSDKSKLKITSKKNPLKDFFGRNINITAIVGENGSGKSNLLAEINKLNFIDMHNTTSIYLLIDNKEIHTNLSKKQLIVPNQFNINIYKDIGDKLDYFIEKNLSISETNYKDREDGESILPSIFEKDNKAFDFINEKYKFTKYKFYLLPLPYNFKLNSGIEKLDKIFENPLHESIINTRTFDDNYYLSIFTIVAVKLLQFTLQDKNLSNNVDYKAKLLTLATNFTKENYLNFIEIIDLKDFKKGYSKDLNILINFDKNKEQLKSLNDKSNTIDSVEIEKIIKDDLFKLFHHFTNNNFNQKFLEIDYITDENLKFNDLSDGEQQKMVQLGQLSKELLEQKDEGINKVLLTFDEPDVFLHPQWQKSIIKEFMIIINKYIKKNFDSLHLIVTSHSPFILSDIPKDNVIFLEKDEETGNCINATKKMKDFNTFGANIHTLLSHGFFMKDGLMGEFAKSKIQSIIKYHEKLLEKELTKEENKRERDEEKEKYEEELKKEFWQIQSIIGDDYLKQVIKNHLVEIEKILLGADEAKEEEIKRLEAQIKQLRK